jgi:hypothetical protein
MRTAVVLVALLAMPAFADEAVPAPAVEGLDMNAWESQVLGGIFGLYCGYYPDRVTIVSKSIGIATYKECAKLFAGFGPACVAQMKAAGKWAVSNSAEGTKLGSEIGACIDGKFAETPKKAPRNKR